MCSRLGPESARLIPFYIRSADGERMSQDPDALPPRPDDFLQHRLASGLVHRSARLFPSEQIAFNDPAEKSPPPGSLAAHFTSRATAAAGEILDSQMQNAWLTISTSLGTPSVSAQIKTLESISPAELIDFNLLYSVGASLISHERIDLATPSYHPEDLAIVAESIARFRSASEPDDRLTGFLRDWQSVVRRASAELRQNTSSSAEAWGTRLVQIGLVELPETHTLHDLVRAVMRSKSRHLPKFGPDLFSVLQALLDPAICLSMQQLEPAKEMFDDWGLTPLFFDLLIMRFNGPYADERAFLLKHADSVLKTMPTKPDQADAAALLGNSNRPVIRRRPKARRSNLIHNILRVKVSVERRDPYNLVESLVDLYCVDRLLPRFLDWDEIYALIQDFRSADPKTVFVTFLTNDDFLRARYPFVAMGMGRGALIGDLTSLISSTRPKAAVAAILSRLRKLPAAAAEALTAALLERSNLERIVTAFPDSGPLVRDVASNDPRRICLSRIAAAQAAVSAKLLPQKAFEKILDAEVRHLRMEYFQRRMRSGRVRINWSGLEHTIRGVLQGYTFRFSVSVPGEQQPYSVNALLTSFSNLLASRLCDEILYKSPDNIDQALSNNLRHGVVVPRFLRAFDDAFQAAVSGYRAPAAWNTVAIDKYFGDGSSTCLELRNFVNDRLKAFVDYNLTIEPGGTFEENFRQALAALIAQNLSDPSAEYFSKLERDITTVTRRTARALLTTAAKRLNDEIRRQLAAEIQAARKHLASAMAGVGGQRLSQFLDYLDTNIHEACGEVVQWLGIADRSSEVIPFKLAELVDLHLIWTTSSAPRRLRVSVKCARDFGDAATREDFSIQGKYLDAFQELLHNLISNAFKHSGQGLNTQVDIELLVTTRSLVLKCRNSLSPERAEELRQKYASIVGMARRSRRAQARRDFLSGFQKMRRACSSAFKRQPVINIPPISRRDPVFNIELTVSLKPGEGVVAE